MNPSAQDLRLFQRRWVGHTVATGFAVGALLGLAAGRAPALGFCAGASASVLCLVLHAHAATIHPRLTPAAAARRAGAASLGRTGVRAAALVVALLRPDVSFLGATLGLFTSHAVLLAHQMFPKTAGR